MHIFRSIGSFVFCVIGFAISLCLVVLVIIQQLESPQRLISAIDQARVPDQISSVLAQQYVTQDVLEQNQITFLTVGQAQTFVSSLFSPAWIDAHVKLFIQQFARLTNSGAQLSDSVFYVSLREPKDRFATQFEELKKTVDMNGAGSDFASMDPKSITDTLPDTINLLHFVAGNKNATPHTSYDPLGIKQYGDPLTAQEVDSLSPMQEKIDMIQLWNTRLALIIPGVILLLLCIMGAGAIWHSSSGRVSVLHWCGLFLLITSLPWIGATVLLRFGIEGRIFDVMHDAPTTVVHLIDQTLTVYGNSLSVLTFVVFLILLCLSIGSIVVVHLLRKRAK